MRTTKYAHGTWIERSGVLFERARAMCSDGVARITKRMARDCDYVNHVPATVRVQGRNVTGGIVMDTAQGSDVPTDDDPTVVKFVAYADRTNGALLPQGKWNLTEKPEPEN